MMSGVMLSVIVLSAIAPFLMLQHFNSYFD
jgi:hypothetical protein